MRLQLGAILAILFLTCSTNIFAQSREDETEIALTLIDLTGEVDVVMSAFDDLMPLISSNIRVQYPDISSRQLILIQDIYREEWNAAREQFRSALAGVYVGHFTYDELLQLRDFYHTPIGQRLVEELPSIQTAAGEAGGRVGMQVDAAAMPRIENVIRDGAE